MASTPEGELGRARPGVGRHHPVVRNMALLGFTRSVSVAGDRLAIARLVRVFCQPWGFVLRGAH